MTTFREKMDAEGDKLVNLVNSFSLPTYQKPYRRWSKKERLADAWSEFVSNKALDVRADLTFKQVRDVYSAPILGLPQTNNRVSLTYELAMANIAMFCERLNYACYKHAYKRYGKRLEIVSAIEGGKDDWRENRFTRDKEKRLHTHILLQLPKHIDFDDFATLIRKHWFATEWGYVENKVERIKSKYRCARYNTKTTPDAIDLENTFFRTESCATQ